jgi:hypothetical protein
VGIFHESKAFEHPLDNEMNKGFDVISGRFKIEID